MTLQKHSTRPKSSKVEKPKAVTPSYNVVRPQTLMSHNVGSSQSRLFIEARPIYFQYALDVLATAALIVFFLKAFHL